MKMFPSNGQAWVGVDVSEIVFTTNNNPHDIFEAIAQVDADFDANSTEDMSLDHTLNWDDNGQEYCLSFHTEDCGDGHYRFPADNDLIIKLIRQTAKLGITINDVTFHFNY